MVIWGGGYESIGGSGSIPTGSITNVSNIGTGEGLVFKELFGSVVQLKTLKAGTNIVLNNDSNEIVLTSTASGSLALTEDTTVNLNSSMTASDIQTLIDAQPKNLNGYNLTFQFADGTYTLDTQLLFRGFVEGTLKIFGNVANNSLGTTKSVTLEFTSETGIKIESSYSVEVRYLKVNVTNAGLLYGIYITSTVYSIVRYNYVICSQTNSSCFFFLSSKSLVIDNMIGLSGAGIVSDGNSAIYSDNNDDAGVGNQPIYGLSAGRNGTIGKNGVQPTGSASNENVTTGGVIR